MKRDITPEDLCKDLPKQILEFIKYVKKLELEQQPDYYYLRSLFKFILKGEKIKEDSLKFSWINHRGRLYRTITNNLKKRNYSYNNNDSRNKFYASNIILTNKKNKSLSKDEDNMRYKNKEIYKKKYKEDLNASEADIYLLSDKHINFPESENNKNKNLFKKFNRSYVSLLETKIKKQKKISYHRISETNSFNLFFCPPFDPHYIPYSKTEKNKFKNFMNYSSSKDKED